MSINFSISFYITVEIFSIQIHKNFHKRGQQQPLREQLPLISDFSWEFRQEGEEKGPL